MVLTAVASDLSWVSTTSCSLVSSEVFGLGLGEGGDLSVTHML